ncbi:hypothetical protein F1654_04230 [Alkalicaulis satelles]|uniref:Uncharacterized protein n=1 Tax=Alkalicaulis satelles TaxID=2609175 RepID=A0A5M6ZK68_9PROT|nr:hypothetical protein F1654_04230 [Alkalicaulis satelles]
MKPECGAIAAHPGFAWRQDVERGLRGRRDGADAGLSAAFFAAGLRAAGFADVLAAGLAAAFEAAPVLAAEAARGLRVVLRADGSGAGSGAGSGSASAGAT